MHALATIIFRLSAVMAAVLLLSSTSCAFPKNSITGRPRVALWVEAEGVNRPYDSAKGFEDYNKFIDDPAITDIFCQVYRGGRSWFSSELADDAPFRKAQDEGFDPLADTIRAAHARGQKVHAWINVLRIANNKNAPIISRIGKSAVLEDSLGVSLLDYVNGKPGASKCSSCKIGTPGIWLDPANPKVRQYLKEILTELLLNYPDLDGVHLDMIRAPITSPEYASGGRVFGVGYAKEVVDSFYAEAGDGARRARYPSGRHWREFRRSQVTRLVSELRDAVRDAAPAAEVSAAVLPNAYRAKRNALQDWALWAEEGTVDTIVPMIYTRSVSVVKRQSLEAVKLKKNQGALIGIGAWLLLKRPTQFDNQVGAALISGADGIALFSYSNMQNKHGLALMDTLKSYTSQYQ